MTVKSNSSLFRSRQLVSVVLLAVLIKVAWNGSYALGYVFQERQLIINALGKFISLIALGSLCHQCLKWKPNLTGLGCFFVACYVLYLIPPINFYEVSFRFFRNKQEYISNIKSDKSDYPKFIVFNWGEYAGFPAGGVWEDLIYDETDQIGLPPEKRSLAWTASHGGYTTLALPNCKIHIIPLEEHFFYLNQVC
jgi:hypothetical protein